MSQGADAVDGTEPKEPPVITLWRHRFEPGRLVLGLSAIGLAIVHLVRATGHGDLSLPALWVLLPAALLLSGAVAVAALAVRRARERVRARRARERSLG